jgi:hypothetical protein
MVSLSFGSLSVLAFSFALWLVVAVGKATVSRAFGFLPALVAREIAPAPLAAVTSIGVFAALSVVACFGARSLLEAPTQRLVLGVRGPSMRGENREVCILWGTLLDESVESRDLISRWFAVLMRVISHCLMVVCEQPVDLCWSEEDDFRVVALVRNGAELDLPAE